MPAVKVDPVRLRPVFELCLGRGAVGDDVAAVVRAVRSSVKFYVLDVFLAVGAGHGLHRIGRRVFCVLVPLSVLVKVIRRNFEAVFWNLAGDIDAVFGKHRVGQILAFNVVLAQIVDRDGPVDDVVFAVVVALFRNNLVCDLYLGFGTVGDGVILGRVFGGGRQRVLCRVGVAAVLGRVGQLVLVHDLVGVGLRRVLGLFQRGQVVGEGLARQVFAGDFIILYRCSVVPRDADDFQRCNAGLVQPGQCIRNLDAVRRALGGGDRRLVVQLAGVGQVAAGLLHMDVAARGLVSVVFDLVRLDGQIQLFMYGDFDVTRVAELIRADGRVKVEITRDGALREVLQEVLAELHIDVIFTVRSLLERKVKGFDPTVFAGVLLAQHRSRDADAVRQGQRHVTADFVRLGLGNSKVKMQLCGEEVIDLVVDRAVGVAVGQVIFFLRRAVRVRDRVEARQIQRRALHHRSTDHITVRFQRHERGVLVPLLVLLGRRGPGGGGGFSIRVVLRVRRKSVRRGGVAQNRVGVRRDGQLGNSVVHVARDQGQRRRAACRVNVRDNRAGLDLIVAAQKYDVAGHSFMAWTLQLTRLAKRHRPGVDARGVRRGQEVLVHAGVMQAERGEHAVPAAVGAAVPCAVAGIAAAGAVVVQLPVAGALGIANLAGCDGHRVLRPVAGQGLLREGLSPVGFPLGVGLGVAVAVCRVGMLRQGADQLTLIAGVGVDVLPCPGFLRGRGAVQHRCVTAVGMGVLLQAAGGFIRHGRADQLKPPEHRQTDQQRQHPQQTDIAMLPPVVPVKAFLILFYNVFHKASLVYFCNKSEILSKGYTLKNARPTICSFSMQPITLLRLSTEVERWSPITK